MKWPPQPPKGEDLPPHLDLEVNTAWDLAQLFTGHTGRSTPGYSVFVPVISTLQNTYRHSVLVKDGIAVDMNARRGNSELGPLIYVHV